MAILDSTVRPRRILLIHVSLFLFPLIGLIASSSATAERKVSCLGRLEPGLGVVRVATPSVGSGVIASLAVSEGEQVEQGKVLATLDDHSLRAADVKRIEAELDNAKRETNRARTLSKRSVTSAANLDAAEIDLRIAKSNLDAANARLELTRIRAPIAGQVLEIHARAGERVGTDGVLEIGDTEKMFAVAEVYETDIAAVAKGQRATIRSPALASPISGVIDSIGLKIGRMDVLDTDPIAKADSRVVEVRIALDSSELVSRLTNLQVEIEIETEP